MFYEMLVPEQAAAFDFLQRGLAAGEGRGLFSQQGTGKTIIALALLEQLLPRTVLLLAPKTAFDATWDRPDRLQKLPYVICHNWEEFKAAGRPEKAARKSSTPLCGVQRPPHEKLTDGQVWKPFRLLLANLPTLTRIINRATARDDLWDCIIIDESQGAKSRGSSWGRAVRRLRHRCPMRLMLSGTPMDGSEIEIWAQMCFIEPGALGGTFTEFADEYCRKGGYMGLEWQFIPAKREAFLEAIRPYVIRLSNKFLKLPPLTLHPEPVPLLGQQRQLYEAMNELSYIRFQDHRFEGGLTVVKNVRLQQITGGFLCNDEVSLQIGHAKERRLRSLLRRLDPPVVVFAKYRHEIELITRLLIEHEKFARVGELHGDVRASARTGIIDAFNAGALKSLVCQQRTGGVSIELTAASTVIVYSMTYSYIDFWQLVARVWRWGQNRPVNVYLIYAEDTEDERIKEIVLQAKTRINASIMKALEADG